MKKTPPVDLVDLFEKLIYSNDDTKKGNENLHQAD